MPLARMDVTGTGGDLSTGCSLNTLKKPELGGGRRGIPADETYKGVSCSSDFSVPS